MISAEEGPVLLEAACADRSSASGRLEGVHLLVDTGAKPDVVTTSAALITPFKTTLKLDARC